MANLKPIGEAQWLITVEGLPGTWSKMTPPKTTVERINYVDPTKLVQRIHPSVRKTEEITISKQFDIEQDGAIVDWIDARLKGKNVSTPFVVTASPVYPDTDGTPYEGGSKFSLVGCIFLDATYPGMDRESKNLSMIELTFWAEAIKRS